MRIDIDAGELNTLAASFARASGRVGGLAAAAVRKTAMQIEADAKVFAPVDTGNLMNSISTDIEGDGRFGVVSAEIGPTAEYGIYVEQGTSVHAPQAFLGPAFDRHVGGLEQALGTIAQQGLG